MSGAEGHAGVPDAALAQAAFISAGTGIYLTDRAGWITAANPRAAALLDRPVTTLLGADAHDLLHRGADGDLIPRSTCEITGVLETGRHTCGERTTFLRGDGGLLPVAWSAAPIRRGEHVLGAVVVFSDITEHVNVRRRQADQLTALEDFTARLTLAGEITSVLTQTLEVDEALQRLGRLLVPRLADWAVVDLHADHNEVDRVVVVPPPGETPNSPVSVPSIGLPVVSLLARVLNRGETVVLGPDEMAGEEKTGLAADQRELFAGRSATSLIATPLRTPRQVLGALTVARTDPGRPFDATDVTLVTDIGRRAGLAVDNARLFGQQRDVAETMQRHLLAPLPKVDHLQMAARYLPAPVGSQVGGDWYDAFLLPDGVTALVIGDVVGHDLKAAAEMAQLRSMLRALAWDRRESPSLVIGRLDQALSAVTDVSMATMILARIEGPEGGPWSLHWSASGHPPPLLVTPDGRARFLEQTQDPLLGLRLGPETPRHDSVESLPGGSTLVLYTDGLVEDPASDLGAGLAHLRQQAAAVAHHPLEVFCDEILRRRSFETTDDIALLAVRLPARDRGA
ncbi:SpoIIE family protein phosphatase [Sphaerimonospora sp. CA-214678]|uniref:SpoIIE family protein phosphatase n=1 Tax=Sphaerimonospora sp. CA-214678 TaxID=3240029 RepID=UPI003D8CCECD